MAARKQQPKKRRPPQRSDRQLREKVAMTYVSADVAGKIHVENLDMIVNWIKTGKLPAGVKPALYAVEKTAS